MDSFQYRDGQLFCEDVSVSDLAGKVGTPLYIYSRATLEQHLDKLAKAFASLKPTICYAIKSCDNLHILKLLAERGAGMDTVSGGEVYRAQLAGASMSKVVFAGVGKTDAEIRQALEARIGYFNIESEAEFENIARIAAEMNASAKAALRVNPDIDPKTHAKTTTGKKETKFGVDIDRARRFFERFGKNPSLDLCAIHLHIGSPIYTTDPYEAAITKALKLIDDLRGQGYNIDTLDIGGGFGADYESGQTPSYDDYAAAIVPLVQPFVDTGGKILIEPGRTVSANAGILLSRVQYIKTGGAKKFVIIDSGMHHMIRPTLYESWMFIWPAKVAPMHLPEARAVEMPNEGLEVCDVVGPICETGDYLAKDRPLPPVSRGDLLAVFGAGAYGRVMSSNYNTMPRPAEILVDGARATIIRKRETYDDILAAEQEPVEV
jgi:diaminopimelate decarboxylase